MSMEELADACDSCAPGDELDRDRCAQSQRTCGHHCNHSWSHDACCWCGKTWGEK